jgi:superfamily II DNA/RNA helicase
MKPNTTKAISSGNLDKTDSMQSFLKGTKILSELCKGVQSMKHYLYPSSLQKQAIPALKSSKLTNILIRYQELTGIKLTLMLPLLNA